MQQSPSVLTPEAVHISFSEVPDAEDEVERRKVLNGLEKVRQLADGSRGRCKLYRNCQGGPEQLFAVKSYRKSRLLKMKTYFTGSDGMMKVRSEFDEVQNEIRILSTIPNHPSLCKLLKVIDSEDHHKCYLVFPLYGGGRLMEYNVPHKAFFRDKWLHGKQVLEYVKQIGSALAEIHRKSIIHRDVKPENILLTTDLSRAVLVDFGCAKQIEGNPNLQDANLKETSGTYSFFSPEMCKEESFSGFQGDVWALGVSLYACLYGVLPYYSNNPKELFEAIALADESSLQPPTLEEIMGNELLERHSDEIRSNLEKIELLKACRKLLTTDPLKRPTSTKIETEIATVNIFI